MNMQDSYDLSPRDSRPASARRDDKGMSLGIAFSGAVCVVGLFGLLALLYNIG